MHCTGFVFTDFSPFTFDSKNIEGAQIPLKKKRWRKTIFILFYVLYLNERAFFFYGISYVR